MVTCKHPSLGTGRRPRSDSPAVRRIGVVNSGVVTPSLFNALTAPVYKESQQTTFPQQLRVQKALCSFSHCDA